MQVCYKEGGRVVRTVHVGSTKSERRLAKLMREAQDIIDGDAPTLFDLKKYNQEEGMSGRETAGER